MARRAPCERSCPGTGTIAEHTYGGAPTPGGIDRNASCAGTFVHGHDVSLVNLKNDAGTSVHDTSLGRPQQGQQTRGVGCDAKLLAQKLDGFEHLGRVRHCARRRSPSLPTHAYARSSFLAPFPSPRSFGLPNGFDHCFAFRRLVRLRRFFECAGAVKGSPATSPHPCR